MPEFRDGDGGKDRPAHPGWRRLGSVIFGRGGVTDGFYMSHPVQLRPHDAQGFRWGHAGQ